MNLASKKLFQRTVAVLAFIPILTGLIGMMGIQDPIYNLESSEQYLLLDSNLRFFAGVWFVLGIALLISLPRIDEDNPTLQFIFLAIFVGGIGRLLSMFLIGMPPIPFIIFTVLEIVGMPLAMVWQRWLVTQRVKVFV